VFVRQVRADRHRHVYVSFPILPTAKKKAQLAAEAARKETEQERSARQAAQAKALEKTALENEAAAIAAVSITCPNSNKPLHRSSCTDLNCSFCRYRQRKLPNAKLNKSPKEEPWTKRPQRWSVNELLNLKRSGEKSY
jgi:hypothetical protein